MDRFSKQKTMKGIFLFIVTNLVVLVLVSAVIFVVKHAAGIQGGVPALRSAAGIGGLGAALIAWSFANWQAD